MGSISDRWMAGLDALGGLFQPWWFYDSLSLYRELSPGDP